MISTEPIVARAPLRISLAGGGTDLPSYYERHGGAVLSTAISRYCSVVATRGSGRAIRITSSDYRLSAELTANTVVDPTAPLALPMVAAAYFLRSGAIRSGLHLVLSSEVPPGTGLGSSSAMAVALIRTLSTVAGTEMTRCEVAELACHLEIELLGMPIGKQDQYASAYGGLNLLTFSNDDVGVRPVVMPYGVQRALDSRLLLFSTGATHHSGTLLRQQRENLRTDPAVRETMHAMKAMTGEMQSALRCGALDDVGRLLHEGWERKKRLSGGMTSERIDTLYTAARAAGALGGKITGAGGGGYLLVYCPSAAQEALKTAMASFGADELPFTFDRVGGQVVSNSHDDRSATVAIVRETRPRSKTLIPR